MSTVLVTGANGFIAQHIIRQLLEKGFNVVGTVRSEEKATQLLNLFQNEKLSLELVPELAKPNAFDELFAKKGRGFKYVIHTASPCHYNSQDFENDILRPAIEGTKSVLNSIKKYAADSVQKVVYTSSFAAISNVRYAYDSSITLTEESWNQDSWDDSLEDAKTAYYGSKAFAERAAWEFLEENQDSVKFTLTTINPCYVFGPQVFDESVSETLNASCQRINDVVLSKADSDVDQTFASLFIDVRDVARAHVLALEQSNLDGKRLILANTRFSTQDIVDSVNKEFPELRGKIVEGVPGNGPNVTKSIATVDNSKSKELLGFKFTPFDVAVHDTVAQILRVRA